MGERGGKVTLLDGLERVWGGVRMAGRVRPHPQETVSGDAWGAWERAGGCRIAVVDGLGHGPEAAEAARVALETLAGCVAEGLTEALRRCHAALRGTRGAALSLADVDVERGILTYAGVGNVEARVWEVGHEERSERPMVQRGVVGGTLPRVTAFEVGLVGEWRVVMHTDGVSARFDLGELAGDTSLEELAERVLAGWGRMTDDATVVVAGRAGV